MWSNLFKRYASGLAVFAMLLIVSCSESPNAPDSSDEPIASATPTATPFREAGTASPAPTAPEWMRVANTDGQGVASRDACIDDAQSSAPGDGIPDGAEVEILQVGEAACADWMHVRDNRGRESWVRAQYLAVIAENPSVSASAENLSVDSRADYESMANLDLVHVSTDTRHSCGLLGDATIACWGDNAFGKANAPHRNLHRRRCWRQP